MTKMTELQRTILAVLEEAGEENLSALRNTIRDCRGSLEEIESLRLALVQLLEEGYIEIANAQDQSTRHWIPLDNSEALAILGELQRSLRWSANDHLWEWNTSEGPLPSALLTDAGVLAA